MNWIHPSSSNKIFVCILISTFIVLLKREEIFLTNYGQFDLVNFIFCTDKLKQLNLFHMQSCVSVQLVIHLVTHFVKQCVNSELRMNPARSPSKNLDIWLGKHVIHIKTVVHIPFIPYHGSFCSNPGVADPAYQSTCQKRSIPL